MTITVKRFKEEKSGKKIKAVNATVSDLSGLLDGSIEHYNSETRSYAEDAKTNDSWSKDPGAGDINNRVRGDFEFAREIMKGYAPIELAGNIEGLMANTHWGLHDGTLFNADAYFNGDPEFMGEVVIPPVEDGQRVLRIAVGIGGNCSIKAEELVRRAARILRVASAYDEAGYSVELFAYYSCRKGSSNEKDDIVLGVIDCSRATVGQAVSMMASAKVFRSLVFSLINWEGSVFFCGYPINHTQNEGDLPHVEAALKTLLGNNTKVIHAGASDEQIKAAVA